MWILPPVSDHSFMYILPFKFLEHKAYIISCILCQPLHESAHSLCNSAHKIIYIVSCITKPHNVITPWFITYSSDTNTICLLILLSLTHSLKLAHTHLLFFPNIPTHPFHCLFTPLILSYHTIHPLQFAHPPQFTPY